MNHDQIVKSKRTLHISPSPEDYGITLETAVPKIPADPPAEERPAGSGSAAGPGKTGTGGSGQKETPGKKKDGQGSLDPAGKTSGTGVEATSGSDRKAGTESGHKRSRLPIIIVIGIIAVFMFSRLGGKSGSSSSSGSSASTGTQTGSGSLSGSTDTGDDGTEGSEDTDSQESSGTEASDDEQSGQTGDEEDSGHSILQDIADSNGTSPGSSDSASAVLSLEDAYEEVLYKYDDLLELDSDTYISDYEAGKYTADGSSSSDLDPDVNYELVYAFFVYPDYTEIHYALKDYNGDGTEELVVLLTADGGDWGQIWAGYTYDGTGAVPLFSGDQKLGYRIDLYTLPDNTFLIHGSGGALAGSDTICRIADDKSGLEVIDTFVYDQTTYGDMSHRGTTGTLTEDEFTSQYYDRMESASSGLDLDPWAGSDGN